MLTIKPVMLFILRNITKKRLKHKDTICTLNGEYSVSQNFQKWFRNFLALNFSLKEHSHSRRPFEVYNQINDTRATNLIKLVPNDFSCAENHLYKIRLC